jgi:hypothetical protein
MRKKGRVIILLVLILFIAGCERTITKTKGLLSYSVKGCINKQEVQTKTGLVEEHLAIEATEDSIIFEHKTNHLCGLDIDIQQSIKDAQITIIEVFTGQGAKCICDSDIAARIYPLEKGIYNLKLYREMNDMPPELIMEREIAVGEIIHS